MIPSLHQLPTSVDSITDLTDDLIMKIMLLATGIVQNIEEAELLYNQTNFFSQDGEKVIRQLCQSMDTLMAWSQTSKLNQAQRMVFVDHLQSLSRHLAQFLGKVKG